MKHPRGSLPWDIHKFVSDSPHGLDIFFCCNLSQLLADIPDDTEHSTAYIHRFLLPDCPINLFFRIDSSWLTGKVRQGVKFIRFRKRKHLSLVRNLMLNRIDTKTGILKNLITLSIAGSSVSNFARICSVTFPAGSVVRRMISICLISHQLSNDYKLT